MLCPSLAAGCCGLTRQVNRADMLQPLLPDTLLKNVNEVGQTRLEWTPGSLNVAFEVLPLPSLYFSPLFSPAVSQYISESCILLSFPIADSCESTSPLYCITDRHFMKFVIHVSHHQHLVSMYWLLETVQTVHSACVIQSLFLPRLCPRARWCSLCRIRHCVCVCLWLHF